MTKEQLEQYRTVLIIMRTYLWDIYSCDISATLAIVHISAIINKIET